MSYVGKFNALNVILGAGLVALPAMAPAAVAKPPQFAQCAVCHVSAKDAKSTIGPNLFGVATRGAGKLPAYAYSPAMKAAGGKWDKARLTAYIQDPRKVVPGNKMAFPGIKDPKVAGAVADYVLSLK